MLSLIYLQVYNSSRIIYRATVPVAEKIRTKGSKNVHTLPNNPTACYCLLYRYGFHLFCLLFFYKKISIVLFNSTIRTTIISSFLSTYFNFNFSLKLLSFPNFNLPFYTELIGFISSDSSSTNIYSKIIVFLYEFSWCSWLSHPPNTRKVSGSNPDENRYYFSLRNLMFYYLFTAINSQGMSYKQLKLKNI